MIWGVNTPIFGSTPIYLPRHIASSWKKTRRIFKNITGNHPSLPTFFSSYPSLTTKVHPCGAIPRRPKDFLRVEGVQGEGVMNWGNPRGLGRLRGFPIGKIRGESLNHHPPPQTESYRIVGKVENSLPVIGA